MSHTSVSGGYRFAFQAASISLVSLQHRESKKNFL